MAEHTNSTVEPNIGFVGLGVMGEPMCSNLAKKTRSKVIGFDLTPDPLERLAEEGVASAASLATWQISVNSFFCLCPMVTRLNRCVAGPMGLLPT